MTDGQRSIFIEIEIMQVSLNFYDPQQLRIQVMPIEIFTILDISHTFDESYNTISLSTTFYFCF